MASPNIAEIATATLANRTRKLADNMSKSTALMKKLKSKGNIVTIDGGESIRQELEYQENGTFRRYSGYDLLDISPSDIMTSANFDPKQAAVAVTMNGREMSQNRGKEQVIDLLSARIKNAERTIIQNIAADCFSDGTLDGGRQINGLKSLISTTPTSGTVGGINRATWSFWRNQKFSGTTDGGAATTSANIDDYMTRLAILTSRASDTTDLIVADDNMYRKYVASLQAIQRITTATEGALGYKSIGFYGPGGDAEVILERTNGPYNNVGMPADTMYFLNTDYLFLKTYADKNFSVDDAERVNTNQDAFVKFIFWMGNMTLSNAALQGVLTL